MHIKANRDVCIGSGNCVLTADDVFDQDEEGTVVVLVDQPASHQESRARDAVARCPSGALTLTEEL